MSIALLAGVATYALFVLYLAYCALMVARRSGALAAMPLLARAICWSVIVLAYVIDVAFNIVLGSVIFLEFPHQLTFTSRCKSHMAESGLRGRIARWICEGWLNPIEPGHC